MMPSSSWFQVDSPLEVGHGETWAPALNIVRTCVTVSMCIIATCWWAVKSNILASASTYAKTMRDLASPSDLLTPLDKRAQRDLDEVRAARFHTFVHVMLPPLVAVNLCYLVVHITTRRPSYECMGKLWSFPLREFLARYSHFSPVVIAGVYKACMFVFVVQMLMVEGPSGIPGRVMAGICLLDCSVSLKNNMLFSAIHCFVTWNRQAHNGASTVESLEHVMQEIHTCVAICSILMIVEAGDRGRIKASLLSRQSDRSQQGVRRLLSAFCDAQVHIGPELQIITNSRPLVHFLGCGAGGVDTQDVFRGDCFLRHVMESDQQRFQEFLAATSALQSEGGDASARAEGAPASIQVSLRNRGGGHVPVELFVVSLPDVDDTLGFLMGIRETGALPWEARVDAPGAVALPPHAGAAVPAEAAGSPPSGVAPEVAAHAKLGRVAGARTSSRKLCSSSSSGSSASRSSCSSGRRAASAAGVNSVSLRLDSASAGMRVRFLVLLTFASTSARVPMGPPCESGCPQSSSWTWRGVARA
ncbi:unnamed protein product [Prorocentrum cordatum]|uniref:Uncharacterized protein n=1 Tax=Prorocentrum cordatum TaxID=2364126 RepID=A0ABN9YC13_9DINO|nr:unnamed protein product [Polarella glacialis]